MIKLSDCFINDLSWMMEQDVRLKSDRFRHIVELDTAETDTNRNSIILIFYNYYNHIPMIVVEHTSNPNATPIKVDGYTVTESGVEQDEETGECFKEFTYTADSIKALLQ